MQYNRYQMSCPRCRGTNVQVTMVTDSMRNRNRGCLWTLGRWMLIICTCGLWLLIGRSAGKSNMQSHKEAICQSCGYSWKV